LRVVIDEFHYILTTPTVPGPISRELSPQPRLAYTGHVGHFRGARSVGDYLGEITGRPFTVYEGQERVTKLVFTPKKPATLERLHDALVFCFSQKGAVDLAYKIARRRPGRERPTGSGSMNWPRSLMYGMSTCLF
jgi:hypothetical protein